MGAGQEALQVGQLAKDDLELIYTPNQTTKRKRDES